MRSPRLPFWLPIAGLLLPLALGLGWILLVLGNNRVATQRLPFTSLREEVPTLTVDQAARLPSDTWRSPNSPRPPARTRARAIWIRFSLSNPTAEPQYGAIHDDYRYTDQADLWIPEGSGWRHEISGETVSAARKSVPGRDLAFAIVLPPRSTQTLYLRIQDPVGMFSQPVWWPAPDYYASQGTRLLAEGIYFGILLALLVYNLLLWIRLGLPGLGWYVLYLVGMGAFLLSARQIPNELGARLSSLSAVIVLSVAASVSTCALAQFTRRFLDLGRIAPRCDRLALALAFAQAAPFAAGALAPWLQIVQPLVITAAVTAVTHVALLVIAVIAWRAGVWQARFFVLSFGCLVIGSLLSIAKWFGHSINEGALLGLMLGSALEMLLLSFAVAERFAQVQHDAVTAQEKLAAEADQRRLIEETYAEELEIEVKERTRELEVINTDKDRILAVIGHDLRGPLTGLMRTADETPGDFARDTARIGRTLLLLIEDLVLWARLRAGTRFLSVHPARNVLAPAVALHNALAEQGGTALLVEIDDELRVETDLVLTQTLVRNLLANALKFARTRVVLRAEHQESGVRFSVSNDGPALSPEVAARIAADESGPLSASGGLGLRLCREICRALGLKLQARSSPEFGTEFSFTVKAAGAVAPHLS